MHRVMGLLGFAGSLACGASEVEVVFVGFPDGTETARSVLVAARVAGRVRQVEAIDLEGEAAAWRQGSAEDELLEALFYERSLSELGLEDGTILRGPDESRRHLPSTNSVFELRLTESGPSRDGWTARGERSAALEAFRLPEDGTECPRFHVENHELPGGENGVMAGRLPSEEVILGDTAGRLWVTNGPELRSLTRRDGGGFALTSVAVAPDTGELFFGTSGGQIHRGRIEADVLDSSYFSVTVSSGYLRFLDVVTSSPSVELYAMSTYGELFHHADGVWTLLHDFRRSGDLAGLQGFVRIDEPGGREILAVVAEDNRVASIRLGEVRLQPTPSPSGLVSIGKVEGLGPIVGNDRGQLFARMDGRWQDLGSTGLSVWMTVVASVEPGLFLFAGAFGNLGAFRDGRSCGGALFLPADPFWLVPVGPRAARRFIALGDRTASLDLWYSEIRLE